MIRLYWRSAGEAQTVRFGRALGRALSAPAWIGVVGPLGAGKTRFIQGAAQGLDYRGRVRSPSYVLEHRYPGGRLPLRHLDLYRLESPDAEIEAGWEEDDRSVVMVEWADRLAECPEGALLVTIRLSDDQTRWIEVAWDPGARRSPGLDLDLAFPCEGSGFRQGRGPA